MDQAKRTLPQPIRVGVFETVKDADAAVADLRTAGFTAEQITVICSEEAVQRHFKTFEHQDPAGAHTPAAAMTGGACGVAIGGVAAVALATMLSMGGAALLVAGSLALWTGGVVGGLVGAMMTRGFERELANYYDQAVERGQILVAAEETDPAKQGKLDQAAKILSRHGVHPMSLPEG